MSDGQHVLQQEQAQTPKPAIIAAPPAMPQEQITPQGNDDTARPDLRSSAQAELDQKESAAKKAEEERVLPPSPIPNAACLAAIAKLWDVKQIPLFNYLPNLQTIKVTPDMLHLAGTENHYHIGKDFIEAQTPSITARTAFEMAILAMGNPALKKQGIKIQGSTTDRYLLTLAAEYMGLKITNPVHEHDVPDALKADCAAKHAEWQDVLKDPHNQIKTNEKITLPAEDAAHSFLKPSDAPIYAKAVKFVMDKPVSNASLRRDLRIGYNRAARLLNEMEKDGIISPRKDNHQRDVLIKPGKQAPQL